MKKVLCILLAILAVFALAAGAGYGLAWYESNHVTIGEHSYYIYESSLDLSKRTMSIPEYDQIQAVLAECDITWQVPFQGKRYSNKSEHLALTRFTERDAQILLDYFPHLKTVDASACTEYALLEDFQAAKPSCTVSYQVDLGGKKADLTEESLTLTTADYTLEGLTDNLRYLPKLGEVILRKPDLTNEQVDGLKAAYPSLDIHCTVDILGTEYDRNTTQLDLSDLTSADVASVGQKLVQLPKLETVEMMGSGGNALSLEEVASLLDMAPQAAFHFEFDFYGTKLSSEMEEVVLKGVSIGDAGEKKLRTALDLLPKCKRFVLDSCGFSDEVLAKVREDYRHQTKVVWRISFGTEGSCLTDVEVFRCVGNLEKNYSRVKYCEDVIFMDIGHCTQLWDIDFVSSMTKLRAAIISGSSVGDLTPLQNCTELEFLELGFLGYVKDLTPLQNCKKLRMLNIADTRVTSLAALEDKNMTHLIAMHTTSGGSRITAKWQKEFLYTHPKCWTKFSGEQPYGTGWRYEKDNKTYLPYYHMLRMIFRYDLYPKDPHQTAFYLEDVDTYLKSQGDTKTLADYQKAVDDDWAEWKEEAGIIEEPAPTEPEAVEETAEPTVETIQGTPEENTEVSA